MSRYKCSVCGYVYNPEIGDPDNDIEHDTDFESLPEDWLCPVCSAGTGMFQPLND